MKGIYQSHCDSGEASQESNGNFYMNMLCMKKQLGWGWKQSIWSHWWIKICLTDSYKEFKKIQVTVGKWKVNHI